MLQRARRVLFCVTAGLASVVTCCSVLAESSLALRHDWRVLFCVKACPASAILCYAVLSECCFKLPHA